MEQPESWKPPVHWPPLWMRDEFPHVYAELYREAFMDRPPPVSDPVDQLSAADLDTMIDSWADPTRPLSKHMELTIAAVLHRKRRNLPPLRGNEPVPGCGCEVCTGLPHDHPARQVLRKRAKGSRRHPPRDDLQVEAARAVPLLEVVDQLGMDQPVKAGKALVTRCPLHDDKHPSFRLDAERGLWHCFPCAEGGDGIRLVQRVLACSFIEAVRFLTT
jgi:hypothetical protein